MPSVEIPSEESNTEIFLHSSSLHVQHQIKTEKFNQSHFLNAFDNRDVDKMIIILK